MSRYIMPLDESLPTSGGQIVSHYVEIFFNTNAVTLKNAVNAFLLALQSDPTATPYIRDVEYQMTVQGGVLTHSCLIHYFLVD